MKLFKIPKKSEKELINFFNKNKLDEVSKSYIYNKKKNPLLLKQFSHHNKPKLEKIINPYPPMLDDLYKLYYIIRKYKRITCLEFGTGWSTLVMTEALLENKRRYYKKIQDLRFNNPFEVHSVDNLKKYINISKKRINHGGQSTHFLYSQNKVTTWNGQICNEYLKLPKINPDFIYLDAPDHKYIDGAISGIKLNQDDFMPMNSDILKIEHFLTPGAIILVDGRTSNANFLKNNFKRNWLYNRDKIRDHSIFILNDEPIGKINKKQISFYLNKS